MGTRGETDRVQPGDVVVALNDQAVASIDDLQPLATHAAETFEVKVRRGSTMQVVVLAPGARPAASSETDAGVGLVIESPRPAFRIDSVLPDSRAARAGVHAGDVVRRINGVEAGTRAQVDRAMRSAASTPMLLEIERDHRRIAILIPERAR